MAAGIFETTEYGDELAGRLALLARFPERVVGGASRAGTGNGAAASGWSVAYRESMPSPGASRDAIPVVLLHGIGSGSASWVHQLDMLGRHRRTLAWDAPGYGRSANVASAEPDAQAYAHALHQWLEALGIARCVVVGHSLGAIMGAAFAALHAERVAGLLLLSPAAGYGKAPEALRREKRDGRLAMIGALGPGGMARTRSVDMVSTNADAGARAWVRRAMSMVQVRGYTQATHLLANADLPDHLRAYEGPLEVVAGEQDTITPRPGCETLARAAGAVLRVVPTTGHAGYVEAPEVFSALIQDFCVACEHGNSIRGRDDPD